MSPSGKARGPLHSARVLHILLVVLLASPLKSSQPFPSSLTAFGLAPSLLPDVSRAARPRAAVLQRRSLKHAGARPTLRARLTGPTWKCAAASSGDFTVAVSTVMGLESIAKQELQKLGYPDASSVGASGRVEFMGGSEAIAKCNLHLRSATRVMLVVARFSAVTFDELYDGVNAINWEDFIHVGASFPVRGKSVKSTLHSVPACQSIVKKAVIARLLIAEPSRNVNQDSQGWLQEDERKGIIGIEVSIQKDEVTISLDTSGDALHRRGYRTGVLEKGAPLKETLAASMLLLSKWTPDRPLLDPFCGSGTILLEAALIAHNIAPGLRRSFAAEDWPLVCDPRDWERLRKVAEEGVVQAPAGVEIFGADIDQRAVEMTYLHLQAAGLERSVELSVSDIHRLPPPPGDFGCVVTNPPYGERLGGAVTANEGIGRLMGQLHDRGWGLFVLSGDETFEEQVGRTSTQRRKLYNGKLPCQLYQYPGFLPRRQPPRPVAEYDAGNSVVAGGSGRKGDWNCPKCKTLVFASKTACVQCSYQKRNDWACPTCQSLVFASKSECFKCGTPREDESGGGSEGGGGGGGGGGSGGRGGGSDYGSSGRGDAGMKSGLRGGRSAELDASVLFLCKGGRMQAEPERTSGFEMCARAGPRSPGLLAAFGAGSEEGNKGEAKDLSEWDPVNKEWARIGEWVCMKQCGACCFLGASDPPADETIAAQLKDMTASDGWCKHFDKESRGCTIYETRPSFCRTSPESFRNLYGIPPAQFETVARSSCCEAIADLYGSESHELDRYKETAGGSYWPQLGEIMPEQSTEEE